MIKKSYKITVNDLILMEDSGSIHQFICVPLPSLLFARAVKRQIEKILIQFDDNRNDDFEKKFTVEDLRHRVSLWIELNQLTALDLLIKNELTNAQLYGIKKTIKSRRLRKIVERTENLKGAFEKIKELTGIKIKSNSDIIEFRSHLEYTRDKLEQIERKINETNQPTTGAEKASLVSIVNGVCMYLNISPVGVEKMKMVQFIDLYKKASAKHKEELKSIEKNKAHGNV